MDSATEPVNRDLRFAGLLLLPSVAVAWCISRSGLIKDLIVGYPVWQMLAAVAGALATVAGWRALRPRFDLSRVPLFLVMLVLAAFTYYAGSAALLAATFLVLLFVAIGGLLDPRSASSPWSRLVAGAALTAAVVGWLLPFQIHGGRLYLVVIGAVLILRWRAVCETLQSAGTSWNWLAKERPGWLALAVLATGAASLGLWLPSVTYDDNAAHLILPDQLLSLGYYRLDVSSQLAAVTPWSSNVLHGIAAVLAGSEVRGAMDLFWLVLGVAGAYRLSACMGGSRNTSLAAAAMYASHPLTAYFGSTMQVDGAVAAVLMHLVADLRAGNGRLLTPVLSGAMLGLLAGLKVSNVVYVILPMAWLAWHAVRAREFKPLLIFVAMAAFVGGSSYVYATLVTGNPVFPLYNAIFKSPFMPLENFHDSRWDTGVNWRAAWDLTFDTTRFGEVYPGAAGVAFLALLPSALLEIVRDRGGRWIAIGALFAGLLMFWQIQYMRYLFPAMAILTTVGLVGTARYLSAPLFAALVTLLLACNIALLSTTSWIARANPWKELVLEGSDSRARLESSIVPERALLARLHARSPGACLLMTDPESPFVGGFQGSANAMAWYDPRLSQARQWAELDSTGARWGQLIQSVGASHLVLPRQQETPLSKALAQLAFSRVDQQGTVELWASPSAGQLACNSRFLQQRDQAHRLVHPWDQH